MDLRCNFALVEISSRSTCKKSMEVMIHGIDPPKSTLKYYVFLTSGPTYSNMLELNPETLTRSSLSGKLG